MEFKIDESKIVKIIVKADNGNLIEYEFDNGEIIGAKNVETVAEQTEPTKTVLSDKEMVDKLKNTVFYKEMEKKKNPSPIKTLANSTNEFVAAQKIIKLDIDGGIDEIIKNKKLEAAKIMEGIKKENENIDKELGHDMCLRNIEKRKEELVKMLGTNNFVSLQKNEDFQKKLADYQDELKRKDEIEADMEADITED